MGCIHLQSTDAKQLNSNGKGFYMMVKVRIQDDATKMRGNGDISDTEGN
jgi:hypothetical protein